MQHHCLSAQAAAAEVPAHGAAVVTHRLEIDAGGSYELTINPPPKLERAGLTDIDAVYIAAQSGSSKSAALVLCAGGS